MKKTNLAQISFLVMVLMLSIIISGTGIAKADTVIDTINVGNNPIGVAFNPTNDDLYVPNFFSNTVSVIDSATNTVVQTISGVGTNPHSVAFNPTNNDMYVTNTGSNTVSVIATTTPVQPPTQTTITSATDGNGNPVQNSGSTVSTSITFQVTATPGTNPIASFECSLDASPFSTCATTNPGTVSYNNLMAGQQHTFEVRAVDTVGNKDPTPATFTWTVLTPQQATQKVISTIDSMHLPRGTTTSLEAPLNAAIRQLNRNNDVAACNTLNAFLHQVNANEANGRLTSHQAADLRQQATAIETSLGCSSTATTTTTTNNNDQETISSTSSVREQQQERALINLRNLAENNSLSSIHD